MLPVPPWAGKRKVALGPQLPAAFCRMVLRVTSLRFGAATRSPSQAHCIYHQHVSVCIHHTLIVCVSYLRSRHSPNLKIIRPHKRIRNAHPVIPHDPIVEILGLRIAHPCLEGRIDHPFQADDLIVFGQHRDVVLEGVGDPEAFVADVGDALVVVPVAFVGEGFVDAVVEVFVVREDYVAANVVELDISLDMWFAQGVGLYVQSLLG